MTTTVLYKICKALNVPSDYILFGKSEGDSDSVISTLLSTISTEEQVCAERMLQYFIRGLSLREKRLTDSGL